MKIRITLLLKEKCILLALLYVVKQKCTTANVVIYAVILFFYSQRLFC